MSGLSPTSSVSPHPASSIREEARSFSEGYSNLAAKIVPIALGIITALGSFALLGMAGGIVLGSSMFVGAYLIMNNHCRSNEVYGHSHPSFSPPAPWYNRAFHSLPSFPSWGTVWNTPAPVYRGQQSVHVPVGNGRPSPTPVFRQPEVHVPVGTGRPTPSAPMASRHGHPPQSPVSPFRPAPSRDPFGSPSSAHGHVGVGAGHSRGGAPVLRGGAHVLVGRR